MRLNSKLSPERYLKNKVYFDSGLIETLEALNRQLNKARERERIYQAAIYKLKDENVNLKFRYRCLTVDFKSLQFRYREKSEKEKTTDEIIKDIGKEIDEIKKDIDEVVRENEELHKENTDLINKVRILEKIIEQERKKKKGYKANSTNSNLPPSSDLFSRHISNTREKSGLKRGGQKGHKGSFSVLNETADVIIDRYVDKAPTGAKEVRDENNNILYYVTQEIDLTFKRTITETRYHINKTNLEVLTEQEKSKYAVNPVTYSNKIKAVTLYLHNHGCIALDRLSKVISVFSNNQINIKPSSICNWQKELAVKSQKYRESVLIDILNSDVLGVDESGWRVNGKTKWLHTLSTKDASYYLVTDKRSDKETGTIKLLEGFNNYLVHDHFKPYYSLDNPIHVECNAHILRYLKAGIEQYHDKYCQSMKSLLQQILHERKQYVKDGIDSFEKEKISRYEEMYTSILQKALSEYDKENPNIAKKYEPAHIKLFRRMLEYKQEHLLFMYDFKVPFDNNLAERSIRKGKTKLKVSGQNNNLDTANYYTSALTIIETSRLRKENPLEKMIEILNN
jgi:transposase